MGFYFEFFRYKFDTEVWIVVVFEIIYVGWISLKLVSNAAKINEETRN